MIKQFSLVVLLLLVVSYSGAQSFFTNNGLTLKLTSGLTATIKGGLLNKANGADQGIIENDGTITLTGDWENNAANEVFATNSGLVSFIGADSAQTIRGTNITTFSDLTINNTYASSPQIVMTLSASSRNLLTLQQGNIYMNGNIFTIGESTTTPGSVAWTSGWFYDGKLVRWFDNTITAGLPSLDGFFPMGSSYGDFRPVWLGFDAAPATGGTVALIHYPDSPSAALPVNYFDASWGETLQGVSNSSWSLKTGDGFSSNGNTLRLRIGGTGFDAFVLTDLNLSLYSSAIGTFEPATSDVTALEVSRSALSSSDIDNIFRIGTKNIKQSPLPVTLVFFKTECKDQSVLLKWKTAAEVSNDYFTLERSIDAKNWEVQAKVDGAGNSSSGRDYLYKDDNASEGTVYYRLKQTDFDGTSKEFNIVAASCGSPLENSEIDIYPNPGTGLFFLSGLKTNAKVIIHSSIGDKMFEGEITGGNAIIDMTRFASGMYHISLQTASEKTVKTVSLIH